MTNGQQSPGLDPTDRQRLFLELLLPLRDRLARFVRTLARTPHDAEDLIADTVLAAYEGFDRLRSREAFLSYLFTVAVRLQRKRLWKRRLFGEMGEQESGERAWHGTSPEVSADIALLREALDKLPAKMREAVVLFEISGLSLEEIRGIQGGSLSGVKSRVTRGRERLAQLLTDSPGIGRPEITNGSTGSVGRAGMIVDTTRKQSDE